MPPDSSATCFGTIVLAGKPNVGKSTLFNALIGEKLAIVSSKAQSTRSSVMGLATDGGCQLLFVDPPGLLEPTSLMQEAMLFTHGATEETAPEGQDLSAGRSGLVPFHRGTLTWDSRPCRLGSLPLSGRLDTGRYDWLWRRN